MSICDLHNYKDAYKIYKILLHKNHSNLIIYGKLEKKVFIKTILDEYFQNKETINIYDEEIYYEYNSYYYYFNIKKIKLDTKDSFIKTIKKISKSYNYFTDKNNYIILDNYDKINPIIENKLKVIIEKTLSTTKFIILTRMFDKVLQANQSRCICIRISLLPSIDKEIYIKNYLKINNIQKEDWIIKELINSYSDINDIIKKIDGYNDPMKIFLQKIVSFMDNKLNKNLVILKELSYNIKNSVVDLNELLKQIINYYICQNISSDKKSKIIKKSTETNYLMINCYKDIIYLEYYLLDIYNILND
tara:strand:+ start:12473 stop:13384 length:912 start_codon:yes stop_codon:yes gene_type:complete